ncbi:MAG: alpha/beta fold hydrolase [Aeromicrobium sp.]
MCRSDAAKGLNEKASDRRTPRDLRRSVLVIWGGRDRLTPTVANVAGHQLAGIEPKVIPRSGHSSMVETPSDLTRLLTPSSPGERTEAGRDDLSRGDRI